MPGRDQKEDPGRDHLLLPRVGCHPDHVVHAGEIKDDEADHHPAGLAKIDLQGMVKHAQFAVSPHRHLGSG